MNIGDRHLRNHSDSSKWTADIYFQLTGPIIGQLQQVFDEDWRFSTGEANPQHIEHSKSISAEETLTGVNARPLPTRIRDAIAWLFSPYL